MKRMVSLALLSLMAVSPATLTRGYGFPSSVQIAPRGSFAKIHRHRWQPHRSRKESLQYHRRRDSVGDETPSLSTLPRRSMRERSFDGFLLTTFAATVVGVAPALGFELRASGILDELPAIVDPNLVLLLASSDSAAGGQEWRQYVPLVVSCLVILDILLGSPAAGLLIAPLRQMQQGEDRVASDDAGIDEPSYPDRKGGSLRMKRGQASNERVDSDAIAQEALDKARNAQELRDYLQRNKTEKDRMEDMKRKIDRQLEDME